MKNITLLKEVEKISTLENDGVDIKRAVAALEGTAAEVTNIYDKLHTKRNVGFLYSTFNKTLVLKVYPIAPLLAKLDFELSNLKLIKEDGTAVLPAEVSEVAQYLYGYNMSDKNNFFSVKTGEANYNSLITSDSPVRVDSDAINVIESGYIFIKFAAPVTLKEIQVNVKDYRETASTYAIMSLYGDDVWNLSDDPSKVIESHKVNRYVPPGFNNAIGYDIGDMGTNAMFSLKFYPYLRPLWDEVSMGRLNTQSLATVVKGHEALIAENRALIDNAFDVTSDVFAALRILAEWKEATDPVVTSNTENIGTLTTSVGTLRTEVDNLIQAGGSGGAVDLSEVTAARTSYVDNSDKASLNARLDFDFQHMDDTKLETAGGTITGNLKVNGTTTFDNLITIKNNIASAGLTSTSKQVISTNGSSILVGNDSVSTVALVGHSAVESPKFVKGATTFDMLHSGNAFKQKVLTQAEYDAIAVKDANTLYFIKE